MKSLFIFKNMRGGFSSLKLCEKDTLADALTSWVFPQA